MYMLFNIHFHNFHIISNMIAQVKYYQCRVTKSRICFLYLL